MLAWILGILWFDVFRIRRTVVTSNLKIAFPEKSEAERLKMGRASVVHLCETFLEYSRVALFGEKIGKTFEYRNKEILSQALAKGKGVLLLTSHVGNGDLAALEVVRQGVVMNLISKHFKSKALDDFWFGLRAQKGMKFIGNEKSTFDILRALKRKEAVVFVIDQFMGPPVGCRTLFFGKETGTAMGLAVFAQKTEAPVVPISNFRREDGSFVISYEKEIPFENVGTQDENIRHMTQKYTDHIEQVVRKHPDQWLWVHKRWKDFRD